MRTVPPGDRRTRIQKVAQLTGDAELGSLVLDIVDAVEDGDVTATALSDLQRYQLGLLATFFDSARRGSLDDVRELALAHAAAASPSEHRPMSRVPTLDDDESRWRLVKDLTDDDEEVAERLITDGADVIDAVRRGDARALETEFVAKQLVPFLDRLAYVDQRTAATEVEGYHSLHG
jgi:hypothetical protein